MAGSEEEFGSFGGASCREFSSLGTAEGCLEEPAPEVSPGSVSFPAFFSAEPLKETESIHFFSLYITDLVDLVKMNRNWFIEFKKNNSILLYMLF